MSGMAEILDENTRLRQLSVDQGAMIEALKETVALYRERDAQAEALRLLVEQQAKRLDQQAVELHRLDELEQRIQVVVADNERLTKHFEFLEKKQQLAKAERFIAADNQAEMFADCQVELPPRDASVEQDDADRPAGDKRKTTKHRRKGRRDLSKLDFPKTVVQAPIHLSTCDSCGGDRELLEPRVSHRVGWQPGHYTLIEVHQHQCACPRCPDPGTWTAPEPFLLPGSMCDDALLVKIIVDKFGDHLPLNRQAARMKRTGFPVGVNVLSGWVIEGSVMYGPW